MEIVINPTAQRIWRTPTSLQIGFGEACALLENLQPKHEKFVHALYEGLAHEQALIYARHLGLRRNESEALIKALNAVLLQNPTRVRHCSPAGKTLSSEIKPREYAEAASIAETSPAFQAALGEMNQASFRLSARGESVWLRRQNRAVFIDKLDTLGSLIAQGLARCGIGAVVVGDQNAQHLAAFESYLETLPMRPQLVKLWQLKERQICRIDLAILTGHQIIEPQKFAAWINRSVAALGVILASAAESLKPFLSHIIVPSQTACWVCLEAHRQSSNPHWPNMASQIVGREMRFDSASASLMVAGQAVERALNHIDELNGFSSAKPAQLWPFDPECSCRLGVAN